MNVRRGKATKEERVIISSVRVTELKRQKTVSKQLLGRMMKREF